MLIEDRLKHDAFSSAGKALRDEVRIHYDPVSLEDLTFRDSVSFLRIGENAIEIENYSESLRHSASS